MNMGGGEIYFIGIDFRSIVGRVLTGTVHWFVFGGTYRRVTIVWDEYVRVHYLDGGEFECGDLIHLFGSTVCQISSVSDRTFGDLLLVCGILVLTRINGDIGLLLCFEVELFNLVEFITKTDKQSGVGSLEPITTASGRIIR